eukprot:3004342-Amphidinium_carterae.1
MILTATGNTYHFEQLRAALEIQFPVHPPADRARLPNQQAPGKGSGKPAKRVHLTDAELPAEHPPGEPVPAEQSAEQELQDVDSLAEVLSVTAQKLRSFTQARGWVQDKGKSKGKGKDKNAGKWNGKPSHTGAYGSQQRPPQPSTSAAAAPVRTSSAPSTSYPARPAPTGTTRPAGPPRSPMTTHVSENNEPSWEQSLYDYVQEPQQEWYGDGEDAADLQYSYDALDHAAEDPYAQTPDASQSYMVYSVPTTYLSAANPAWDALWQQDSFCPTALMVILDTACQRSVCGAKWLKQTPVQMDLVSAPEHE